MGSKHSLPFSVLMSVYIKDKTEYLKAAIESLLNQKLLPTEIVIVLDGPISDTNYLIIKGYQEKHKLLFKIHALDQNMGLGYALASGLKLCSHELVARMDSDDLSLPNRFKTQVEFFKNNHQYAVVGSNVEEFNEKPGDLGNYRIMPEKGCKLISYAKFRSPVNHPSIMFRKSAVFAVGNYNGHIGLFEDYNLFMRLILNGFEFYNIQETLLYFRVDKELQTIKRRSGIKYLRSEITFLLDAYYIGYLKLPELIVSIMLKAPIRLMPPALVQKVYNTFLRRGSK